MAGASAQRMTLGHVHDFMTSVPGLTSRMTVLRGLGHRDAGGEEHVKGSSSPAGNVLAISHKATRKEPAYGFSGMEKQLI